MNNDKIPTLSACLVVRNEEKNIRKCLDNIKNLVDEIIIVDGFSEDNTVSICKEYTEKVYLRQPEGYCEPDRNYTIEKATCDWILIIDPDETLERSLCATLRMSKGLLKYCEQRGYDIIALKRKNIIDGVFMNNERFYPDYQLRIFKNNGKIKYTGKIHEAPIGFIKQLSSDYHIIHEKTKEAQESQNKRYQEIYEKYSIEDVWS